MSFSNKRVKTPVQLFIRWAGSKGHLAYWDKEASREVVINSPVRFIVLDQLNTIGGFSDSLQGGIWANEVRNTRTEPLYVRCGAAELEHGLYNDIKDKLKGQGGRYARSLYVLVRNENRVWVIANLKLVGAAMSVWFDYVKQPQNDPEMLGVELVGADEEKKGSNTYFVPVFKPFELSTEEVTAAINADRDLQTYLKTRSISRTQPDELPDEDEAAAIRHVDDVVIEDIDDRPIDLSEIPF